MNTLHILVRYITINVWVCVKYQLGGWVNSFKPTLVIVVPTFPNLCPEAMVDCVGKSQILSQCSCFTAPLNGYESALWWTRMLLPNAGRKFADWLLHDFIQYANIQVLITRSITGSVQKFGGCVYDDDISMYTTIRKIKHVPIWQNKIS